MHHLAFLIHHYGYFGIIIALIGGIVGLPIPDEVLLTFVGYNVYLGKMSYLLSLLCAMIGACGGITFSFILGIKLGVPFLNKFGPKLHITEPRIERTKNLFAKFGPFLLMIGFFIPGLRHVTAYLAGINSYSYKKFAVFAYTGAFIWTFLFITLGRILGENWVFVAGHMSRFIVPFIIIFLPVILISYSYWRKKKVNRLIRIKPDSSN